MRRPTFSLPSVRSRQIIGPLALAAALTLAACSSGSSNKTATSASQTTAITAAATTAAATTTTTTAATTAATSTAAATAAATTAITATTAATTAAATTASGSGGSVVDSAFEKQVADAWAKVKSYKITMNVYDGDTTTASLIGTIETTLPDATHTTFNVSGQTIETINVGGKSYIKIGDTWQESPAIDSGIASPVSGGDIVGAITTPTSPGDTIAKKGAETLDGVATDVYENKTSDGTTVTIWIGQKDHLPRKSVVQDATSRTEIIFSDYNSDFGIKAPI
jgi:hypothetical protein